MTLVGELGLKLLTVYQESLPPSHETLSCSRRLERGLVKGSASDGERGPPRLGWDRGFARASAQTEGALSSTPSVALGIMLDTWRRAARAGDGKRNPWLAANPYPHMDSCAARPGNGTPGRTLTPGCSSGPMEY